VFVCFVGEVVLVVVVVVEQTQTQKHTKNT
jgi:hypothetical protein